MKNREVTFYAFIMIILSFISATIISAVSIRSLISSNSQQNSTVIASNVYNEINNELSKPIIVGRTMANDKFLIDQLQKEDKISEEEMTQTMMEYLKKLNNSLNYESAFVVSGKTLNYYTVDGLSKKIDPNLDSHDIWYQHFLNKNKEYDLDVDIDEINKNKWTVFVNVQIQDENDKLIGICGVGVVMKDIQNLFLEMEKEYGIKIHLTDETGLILVDTDEINIENAYLDEINVSKRSSEEFIYRRDSSSSYSVTKYVENLGWFMVIRGDVRGLMATMTPLIAADIILALVFILIFALGLHILFSKEKELERQSIIDRPTGLFNRTRYESVRSELMKNSLPGDFALVVVDVNHLKYTNDTYGHQIGDELIKATSEYLIYVFGEYGKIYRVGGDEFIILIDDCTIDLYDQIILLKSRTILWEGSSDAELSVAAGYAYALEHPDCNYDELVRIADKKMYEDKASFYRISGNDRRKERCV